MKNETLKACTSMIELDLLKEKKVIQYSLVSLFNMVSVAFNNICEQNLILLHFRSSLKIVS